MEGVHRQARQRPLTLTRGLPIGHLMVMIRQVVDGLKITTLQNRPTYFTRLQEARILHDFIGQPSNRFFHAGRILSIIEEPFQGVAKEMAKKVSYHSPQGKRVSLWSLCAPWLNFLVSLRD